MYILVLITLILLSLLVDLYFYIQFKTYINKLYKRVIYWIPGIIFSLLFIALRLSNTTPHQVTEEEFYISSWVLWIYYFLYFPKILFVIFDLINKLLIVVTKRKIKFFRYLAFIVSLGFAVLLVYGTIITRTNFQTRHVAIKSNLLPKNFNNFKIIQISDIHLGGWGKRYEVMDTVVAKIMKEKPDMIVMTGDMVNNFASELDGWAKHFCCLKAKYGVYAILGNHDYGDYSKWPSKKAKEDNLNKIKNGIRALGFNLMLDTNIIIHKGNDSIALIGVQNWGRPPFPRYGNFKKALTGCKKVSYKILLSHDPTHWDAEVVGKTDIILTLSGHTHGMQLGYDDGKHKFSPSQWIFKQWNGLYQENHQYIYVNEGIGYVGAPFRIGIRPEITVITLQK